MALQQRLAETEESLKRELHRVALLDAELERLRASPTCRLRSRRAPCCHCLLCMHALRECPPRHDLKPSALAAAGACQARRC